MDGSLGRFNSQHILLFIAVFTKQMYKCSVCSRRTSKLLSQNGWNLLKPVFVELSYNVWKVL